MYTIRRLQLFVFLFLIISPFIKAQSTDSNKNVPKSLASAVSAALLQFPELSLVPIDFVFKAKMKNCTMQAQPKVSSFLKHKKKRRYKIKITRHILMEGKLEPIENLPENILVGWFAHELGHIMDYTQRSSLNLTAFGLKYITSKVFVRKAEKAADMHAVDRGFTNELIATKKYILNHPGFTKEYKERIDDLYLSPQEISAIALMDNSQ